MPAGNPLGYMDPRARLALFEALGIPPTDMNLYGHGGYETTQDQVYPLESHDQGDPSLQNVAPQFQADPVQEALRALSTPEPPVEPVQAQPINPIQRLLAGLGDAMVSYGRGTPTGMQDLLYRRQLAADEEMARRESERRERVGSKKEEARARLEIALGEREREDRRADEAGRRAEEGVERLTARQMAQEERERAEREKDAEYWEKATREAGRFGADIWTLPRDKAGRLEAERRIGEAQRRTEAAKAGDKSDRDAVMERRNAEALGSLDALIAGDADAEPIVDPQTGRPQPNPAGMPLAKRLRAMPPDDALAEIASIRRAIAAQNRKPMSPGARAEYEVIRDEELLPVLEEYEREASTIQNDLPQRLMPETQGEGLMERLRRELTRGSPERDRLRQGQ